MTLSWQLKPTQVTHKLSQSLRTHQLSRRSYLQQVRRCVQGQLVNESAEAGVFVTVQISSRCSCVWSRKVEALEQACDLS